jgi:hypothetical protein
MGNGILGPSMGYVDLLQHETAAKIEREHDDFNKSPLRPSASGHCTRELFYELQNFHGLAKHEREHHSPELHRLFSLGHSVEWHVIKQFELLADVFDIRYKQQVLSFKYLEAPTNKELSQWLEGSLDMVFWSPKWKCVADVKSKKDRWSGGFKSNWDETTEKLSNMQSVQVLGDQSFWVDDLDAFLLELNDPFFAGNFTQLNMYANSEFLKERGVDHGAIIQYNKNDSRMREIRFRPSAKLYEATIGKFQTVLNAVDANDESLAPKDYMLGSMKCAYCPFSKQCWGEDARKAWYRTLPAKRWPTDTHQMGEHGDELEQLFGEYEQLVEAGATLERTETEILRKLEECQETKVRLSSGAVYEVKGLKNGPVIRRSKA